MVLIVFLLLSGCSPERQLDVRTASDPCVQHLWSLFLSLQAAIGDGDRYPETLAALAETNAPMLVCPATGHLPGLMSDVDSWSDYVYISGDEPTMIQHVALLICPPVNHGGRYGHVLYGNSMCSQISNERFDALMRTPWMHADTNRSGFLKYGVPRIRVHIPARYRRDAADRAAEPSGAANRR